MTSPFRNFKFLAVRIPKKYIYGALGTRMAVLVSLFLLLKFSLYVFNYLENVLELDLIQIFSVVVMFCPSGFSFFRVCATFVYANLCTHILVSLIRLVDT